MANNVINRVWNQNRMVTIEDLKGMVFQAESGGHTFQISGVDDAGNTVALSGSVAGVFLRPDNTDVAISGSASGGVVSVTLPANCYDVPGRFGLTIFVTANGQKTAVYSAIGTVSRTSSGTAAPGTVANVTDLINRINAAVATIPASWTGLMADIAPTYSTSALYAVGQYVYYNGDLYRCTTAITTAESWTAAHWTAAVLGNDVSDLKSAVTDNFAEFTSITNNLWVNFYGEFNGVTFSPNGYGGVKISGTCTTTGSFRYIFPTPYTLNGVLLQYRQTNPPEDGSLYIYCRKSNYSNLRNINANATSGQSSDSNASLELAMIEFVVYSGKSYDTEIYVILTEGVTYQPFVPRKFINANYAESAGVIGNVARDIVFWGDSLTAGYGGNGTTYPAVCANILGKNFFNYGHGGESSNTIAARQGGNSWIIPAGAVNGDYTKSDMLDIFGAYVLPLRQIYNDESAIKFFVKGKECTLTRKSQSSVVSDDIIYTVSGYSGDVLTIPTPTEFYGGTVQGKITCIFIGTNGTNGLSAGTEGEIEARITIIDSMIAHVKNKQFVILGLSNGTEAVRASEDAKLLAHYGNNFFPTRKLLANYGMTIEGLTPTEEDTAYINAGVVPPSLRVTGDSTHLNANGYHALGVMLADKIRSLGYVD